MTHDAAQDWPGRRLAMPRNGVGSMAGFGARLVGFAIDAVLAAAIAQTFTWPRAPQNWSLLSWFLLTAAFVGVFGASPGQFIVGIRVATFRSAGRSSMVGLWAIPRTVLVALVVPVLLRDTDGRSLHDRLCQTIVVRTR